MRTMMVVLTVLFCVSLACAADRGVKVDVDTMLTLNKESVEGKVMNEIKKIKPIVMPTYPYPAGKPHVVMGNMLLWTVNHSNSVDGWSLTGRAIVKLDRGARRYRWKFGIVSAEMELMRTIHDPYLRDLWDDDRAMQYGLVIGIHFVKEF